MTETTDIECPECGAEFPIVQGDLLITEQDDGWTFVSEVNMHGTVELGQGEDLPAALRDAATRVEEER